MSGRLQRERRVPVRYTDSQALDLVQDSDEDISDDNDVSDSSDSDNDDDREPLLPPDFDPVPAAAPPLAPAPVPDDFIQLPLPYWNQIPWANLMHGPLLVDESLPYQWEDFRQTDNVFAFLTREGHDPGFHMEDLFGSVYHNPTELECFEAIFTEELQRYLIHEINDFADVRIRKNTPARRRSRFTYDNWTPVNEAELYKYIAVVTAMGIDNRPSLRDYWSTADPFLDTPWYNKMFHRERFEVSILQKCVDLFDFFYSRPRPV